MVHFEVAYDPSVGYLPRFVRSFTLNKDQTYISRELYLAEARPCTAGGFVPTEWYSTDVVGDRFRDLFSQIRRRHAPLQTGRDPCGRHAVPRDLFQGTIRPGRDDGSEGSTLGSPRETDGSRLGKHDADLPSRDQEGRWASLLTDRRSTVRVLPTLDADGAARVRPGQPGRRSTARLDGGAGFHRLTAGRRGPGVVEDSTNSAFWPPFWQP